jgi:hypothetical protein
MRHGFRLSCIAITCMALVALNSQCSGVPQSGTPTGSRRNSSVVMGAAAALQVKFARKMMCVVFLPDGTAVAAGRGILSRSSWKIEAGQICGPDEPEILHTNREDWREPLPQQRRHHLVCGAVRGF